MRASPYIYLKWFCLVHILTGIFKNGTSNSLKEGASTAQNCIEKKWTWNPPCVKKKLMNSFCQRKEFILLIVILFFIFSKSLKWIKKKFFHIVKTIEIIKGAQSSTKNYIWQNCYEKTSKTFHHQSNFFPNKFLGELLVHAHNISQKIPPKWNPTMFFKKISTH